MKDPKGAELIGADGRPGADTARRQFGAVAGNYAKSAVFALGADLAELVRAAEPTGQELALDLGTAAGHTALALAPHVKAVTGVDLAPEMLEQAQTLARERGVGNVRFEQADVEHLPYPDGSFDLVATRFSGHHWTNTAGALTQVARILRPGGRFILVDTVGPTDPEVDRFILTFERLRDPSHHRSLSPAEWLTQVSAIGLKGEIVEEWGLELDFEDWVSRMRTPPDAVATLRNMLESAPEPVLQAYNPIWRDGRRFFTLPCALLRGRKSG
jgi:SAM-dependent methyltransferase